MKRIIITGANGFIGRYVTKRLAEAGYCLYMIDRKNLEASTNDMVRITMNLTMENSIDECVDRIKNADVMLHLAADITVPGDASTIGNNIDGMCTALEIARRCRVKQFILLSSIPLIGNILHTPIDEEHEVMPKSLYHWSKYLCEQMLDNYKNVFETTMIIRIPSPIGAGMRDNVYLSVLLRKMKQGEDVEVYGNGSRIQNYIDVRDISSAILKAIERNVGGLYLIAGEKSVSNLQLAELCKRITKSKSDIRTGVHPDSEEAENWTISYDKARRTFDYIPEHTLEESVKWISDLK